jgi:DNA-binding CsgD family transcriptional regulator
MPFAAGGVHSPIVVLPPPRAGRNVGATMHRLSASDLEAALRFLHDAGEETGPDAFPVHLVDRLRALIGCEWGSYCELDRRGKRVLALVEAPVMDEGDAQEELFWRIVAAHPICRAQARGRFDALKLSDFHTPRALRRTELYNEWFRPVGVEYELEVALPSRIEHTKTFLFDDARRDFGERERALLNLLQPHLVQLDRNAALRRRAAVASEVEGLTPRESEVLRLVGEGMRNAEIAEALWVSPATVRKHLENIYEKLGVHTRTAAVAHLQRQDRV